MKVVTFGRNPELVDIPVDDDSVSRAHMQIVQHDDGHYTIIDLNSTNKTYVNGREIYGEVELSELDVVKIGNSIIKWKKYFESSKLPTSENPLLVDSEIHAPSEINEMPTNNIRHQNNESLESINESLNQKESYAGFWLRFGAVFIDSLLLIFLNLLIILLLVLSRINWKEIEVIVYFLSIPIGWLYFALMESSDYQGTLGKIAVRIKVTDINGQKIDFKRATGRYFGKIISALILYIGFIMAGITEKKQALHDKMANCLVVRKKIDFVY